jgi:hypothetical protein
MSRRKSQACCCGDQIYLTNCNAWQQACFNRTNPADFPNSCTITASSTHSRLDYCCWPDGTLILGSTRTASFTASISGVKDIGGAAGFGGWGQQQGVRYVCSGGSFTYSETYSATCCPKTGLQQAWTVQSSGSWNATLGCGACQLPNASAPCGAFGTPFYRGWSLQGQADSRDVPWQVTVGDCLGGEEIVNTSYPENFYISGQFDGCSTTQGCEFCGQPACFNPAESQLLRAVGLAAFGQAGGIIVGGSRNCSVRQPDFSTCYDLNESGTISISFV